METRFEHALNDMRYGSIWVGKIMGLSKNNCMSRGFFFGRKVECPEL